jgi:predicted DNA-binding protein YlxM (UPF0122 family)
MGKFEDATKIQEQAIGLLIKEGQTEELVKYEERLKFYKARKPWREK